MTARRAGASAVALTVLAVGVMLVMVMFAARSGPERLFTGPLHDPSVRPITPSIRTITCPTSSSASPDANALPGCANHFHSGDYRTTPFLDAVGIAIKFLMVACFLCLLYFAGRALLRYLADRTPRTKPTRPGYVDFDVLDDPEPLVVEMREDADEQFELLLGGHPRNAIVACWDRFEEQAERVHASRKPWETSSEFTLRLLGAVSADPDAVSRLESLYREARFSEHEIYESHRQSAVEALRAIHASLGIGARAR